MISLSLKKELRERIVQATSFLPPNTPLKIRALTIHMGLDAKTFPRCVCGNYVTYEKTKQKSLAIFCGPKCSRSHRRRLSETAYQKLDSQDWMYEQRINLQRSIEEIAEELDCSIQPVLDAIKKHNIPRVRYNESSALALARLRDKDWLHEQHIVLHRKLDDIANEINSTKSTVSIWLKKHDIIANKANSYDRVGNNSKEEEEVVEFIKSIIPESEIITSNRSILEGKEIDIVIPSRKFAIEYNGIYSHLYRPWETKEALIKGRNYHLGKTLGAQAQGYTLIHIFSDDWMLRKDIWKSIIMARLGVSSNRVGARACQIITPSQHEKNAFLRENHLQGADKSKYWAGLSHGNELIALMTYAKSRYNRSYDWELVRFCVKKGFTIPGGFSKLLKHMERICPGSVISYADFSRSTGQVYTTNGFSLLKRNPPSYAYVNLSKGIERLHRSQFMKSRLPGQGTEYERMRALGYEKIYDCGTLTFIKNEE